MLSAFLRTWLANAAKQRLYEAAQQAARGGAAAVGEQPARANEAGEEAERAARQRPCDVGLVFALGIEAGGLEDRLSGTLATEAAGFKFLQGSLKGRHVVVVQSGLGSQAAAKATAALIAGHHPRWIVSTGFAGGLRPELKRYDFLLANAVADIAGQDLAIDVRLPADARPAGVHVGKLLTIDRIIRRPAEKQALGERHAAMAVDMESLGVAQICSQEKVRFMAVRIISDTMQEELPPDVDRLVRKKTHAGRLGAAVGAIVQRPSSLKDMLKLKEDALVATDRLAKFLEGVIVQLGQ